MLTTFSIAFYNLENLFDIYHNKFTLDKNYTSKGSLAWNDERYQRKIQNLSKVISKIGLKHSKLPPILIGVSEVENKACLLDLINSEKLKPFKYGFVHYDSPDERGIDVAFLFQKEFFELIDSNTYTLFLTNEKSDRDFTRDILLVKGKLFNEMVYIIVNHWPSRQNGTSYSDEKRVKAAKLVLRIIEDIRMECEDPKIVIMGDFNDQPNNNSIKNHLLTSEFFNPMSGLQQQKKGSINFKGKWYLFDQIILSNSFLNKPLNQIKYKGVEIFDANFLQEKSGKRKGSPKRTYIGKWHQGGFSDHFPVLTYFEKWIK